MLTLITTLPLLLAQDSELIPATPYDLVLELELTADSEPIEGSGPGVVIAYEIEFSGTIHIWTKSELDLVLRVRDLGGRLLAEDDVSGGGDTPYIGLGVDKGNFIDVHVASRSNADLGALELHLIACPETEVTRAAAAGAREALQELGRLMAEGDRLAARDLMGVITTEMIGTAGAPTSQALTEAGERLANSMHAMGDLSGARALRESVIAAYERSLPEDHRGLLTARENLANSMYAMEDLAGARVLRESVLAAYERSQPEDHPDLLRARFNLANSMHAMGDLAVARGLRESVLAATERTLPEDHPDLLSARVNLAASMYAMGDLAGARALRESVLAAFERSLPEDHPYLLSARVSLAASMFRMGDLAGARALHESILAARERSLPEDHPYLLSARANLAASMHLMGDLAGARALNESVLAAYERSPPEYQRDPLSVRENLANSMDAMGDQAGARALRESVLAAYERSLPEDHPDLLSARANLAISMDAMGDLAGARALRESVLAAYERSLPEDHPYLLSARESLATSMDNLGDLAGARALYESVLAARERGLPEDHPVLLRARVNLATTMGDMGDLAGARALLPKLVAGMRARVLASLGLAPRQSRQTVASESSRHSQVLYLSESAGSELEKSVFELTETMRLVAAESARSLARFDADPELASILDKASEVRRALNDLVAGTGPQEADLNEISTELTALSLRRDRLERRASKLLADRGVVTRPVDTVALTAALASGDAAVGFRRIAHWYVNEAKGRIEVRGDHLLAHVLAFDGELARIDLGPALELEELAGAWRSALGAPILRGVSLAGGDDEDPEWKAGGRLRARILDPVLELLGGDVERLFVCADDLLFLLPLDALPGSGDGTGRIGDRMRIVNEVSFARLSAQLPPADAAPSLLAIGGVDYDAEGAVSARPIGSSAPIEASGIGDGEQELDELDPGDSSDGRASRSSVPDRFEKLLQARHEAEATAELFEEAFDTEPTLLTLKETTKAALFQSAPGKRYLHLATHGWFAPESVRSTEDAQPDQHDFARMGIEERVIGLAPMTLCGLALAGANRGRDSLGRVPGILTAEELCSSDLSQCELAVLSACETNVGIRRAGQGIQSLQSALYAAGARTSITSLWKVDDAATRRLFEVFYRSLWIEKMGKADSLWRAKMALRDQGYEVRDWAGWVLTGDPE